MQKELMELIQPKVVTLREMGPPLRMESSFKLFSDFEKGLTAGFGSATDDDAAANGPLITFYGSNDFHHLTLALVRRFHQPFNLVRRSHRPPPDQ
jgi:hypothetical protein